MGTDLLPAFGRPPHVGVEIEVTAFGIFAGFLSDQVDIAEVWLGTEFVFEEVPFFEGGSRHGIYHKIIIFRCFLRPSLLLLLYSSQFLLWVRLLGYKDIMLQSDNDEMDVRGSGKERNESLWIYCL